MDNLFNSYAVTDDPLTSCAIAYLIKNGGKILERPEDPDKYAQRIHSKRKEIEQLEGQLLARLPKGRDLTGEEFLETLAIATQQVPETVAQQKEWQAKLLARPVSIPYPIIYGSAVDVRWGNTAKGRITVSFNGMDKFLKEADPDLKAWFKSHKEYPFRIHCDQRQLPYFQRFLADWQDYQQNKDTYPAGLLTLSSALLAWREGKDKGEPWNVNHLALYCSFDTRLMTAEGTLEVQQQKLAKAAKTLPTDKTGQTFTENQKQFHQRSASSIKRLNNIPTRPSRKSYSGKPEIVLGLSLGLAVPVTVAVVNAQTGQVITYRTPKTLLGQQFSLFNRQRQKQQQNSLQRHKNQCRGVTYQPSESNLGEQVDRLIANAIIQLAKTYQAGSIVIPSTKHLRDILNSEITAKAVESCPGCTEAQVKYAKAYRQRIHRWSYNRLMEVVRSKAQQQNIAIESGFQSGNGSAKEQARDIAIAAFHERAIATK